MNQQKQLQAEGDYEISLIDVLLFLKASGGNIVKSTSVCLLVGGVYFFSAPKMYEAIATIEMAKVAGVPVDNPAVLMEKINLALYFSSATAQNCTSDDGLISQANFDKKIKSSLNIVSQYVTIATQFPSKEEAKVCLDAVIADITSQQEAAAKPLIHVKKKKLQLLIERLNIIEESNKNFNLFKRSIISAKDELILGGVLSTILNIGITNEINNLRNQVSELENELITTKTHFTSLLVPVNVKEVPTKMRPAFILGLSLVLGAILGLLVTWVMRVVTEIRRQMREVEDKVN